MNILLVSVNNEKEPCPVAPIGAAYVAGALNKSGHEVRLLDLCFVDNELRALTSSISEFRPSVIGLSLRNIDNLTFNKSVNYLPGIKSIVDVIRKHTAAPIVIGGSGFSIFAREILEYLTLDYGIAGEGETAFPLFADAVHHGGSLDGIPNLCYFDNGTFRSNEYGFSDFIGSPDRSFLDNGKYLDLGGMANIQSKRGCPFRCNYCTYPGIHGNRLRLRDPGAVVVELEEMLEKFGIDYVFFVDDIFNFPEEHAALICEEIISRDLNIDWTCFATPAGMTPELVRLMKKAGCRGIEFGSDGGTAATLQGLGKQFTPDDVAHAAEHCGNEGVPNAHYLIIGGPGENHHTLEETFSFFDGIHPTAVIALTGLRIYPDTRLREIAIEDNIIHRSSSILEPVFYLSPDLDAAAMNKAVQEHAARRGNWIVPGLNIRYDADRFALLRKLGKRGSLWDML